MMTKQYYFFLHYKCNFRLILNVILEILFDSEKRERYFCI